MQIIECVPNISEGRRKEVIESIVNCVKNTNGIKFLDYSYDYDHNRSVLTFVGDKDSLKQGVINLFVKSVELIDLTKHKGEHPRMGAVDVCPFIPVKDVTIEECVNLAKEIGQILSEKLNLPIYLYEYAATLPHRKNLADIRKGEFEGLKEKMTKPEWKPDFGPDTPHPTAGASVIGVREFLIAYNINLNTSDINIANQIAKAVRARSGGLAYVKAIGINLSERNIAQVSMNLVNFNKTPIYRVFELVKIEAQRYGVSIIGSEIVGLIPQRALLETAAYYLQIENWDNNLVLENRIFF